MREFQIFIKYNFDFFIALFRQQRLGKEGKLFTLYKFRTMRLNSEIKYNNDNSTIVYPNDDRLTNIVKFLRIGFDELPQLFNILKGEMSFVGPRPDPLFSLEMYSDKEKIRLKMRPGITGFA